MFDLLHSLQRMPTIAQPPLHPSGHPFHRSPPLDTFLVECGSREHVLTWVAWMLPCAESYFSLAAAIPARMRATFSWKS